MLFIFCLLGCTKTKDQQVFQQEPHPENQEEPIENYEEAAHDHQEAVAVEPDSANSSRLSNILYTWAISQSKAEDASLLNAQKRALLNPQQFALRQELLTLAVDEEKDVIHAFGLGILPGNVPHTTKDRLLARKAALTDAYAWIARLAMWTKVGVEASFDVSRTVFGVESIKEFWVGGVIFVVKVEAPLKKNIEG
jgi:hypothetical protein